MNPSGAVGHGFDDACAPLGSAWGDFGGESWLVALGYVASTGLSTPPPMNPEPPTFNGSGFIDEIAWLLVPAPARDRWRIEWDRYRQDAVERQLGYYRGHCYAARRLFGLSAAEVPAPDAVAPDLIYQPFGVGGVAPANDRRGLLGHGVVAPHYIALISSLRPRAAIAAWEELEAAMLFTPLNNVESLMIVDDSGDCGEIVWNAQKGS